MVVEVEIFNIKGRSVDRNWVFPGKRVHIPQYLSDQPDQSGGPAFYYQVYCARNNAYSLIERVAAVEKQGKNGERIFMAEKTGDCLVMLRQGQSTKPLPVRYTVHGPIENYKFTHKGPKLDLGRRKKV